MDGIPPIHSRTRCSWPVRVSKRRLNLFSITRIYGEGIASIPHRPLLQDPIFRRSSRKRAQGKRPTTLARQAQRTRRATRVLERIYPEVPDKCKRCGGLGYSKGVPLYETQPHGEAVFYTQTLPRTQICLCGSLWDTVPNV